MEIKVLASSSAGNAYKISDGNTDVLLDAGISLSELRRKMNFKTSGIGGVMISHSHKDHCKAVPDLLKAGIDVYMSRETALELKITGHRLHIMESKKQLKIGTWSALPFPLEHDVFNFGYLLASGKEKLLYITDTFYCRFKFAGLTHILIECNHSYDILDRNVGSGQLDPGMKNRLIRSHFSLENVKEFLRANDLSKVREIYLIHLSADNSDEARFKREVQELTGIPTYIAGE